MEKKTCILFILKTFHPASLVERSWFIHKNNFWHPSDIFGAGDVIDEEWEVNNKTILRKNVLQCGLLISSKEYFDVMPLHTGRFRDIFSHKAGKGKGRSVKFD